MLAYKTAKGATVIKILLIVCALLVALQAKVASADLSLSAPSNGRVVCALDDAVGTAADVRGPVWVIVRSLRAPTTYWVQEPAQIEATREWRALVRFGEPGQNVNVP